MLLTPFSRTNVSKRGKRISGKGIPARIIPLPAIPLPALPLPIFLPRFSCQQSCGARARKATARNNALRYGLRAETLVLPDEDPAEFERFRDSLIDELAPGGELEAVLVERGICLRLVPHAPSRPFYA